jgi:hypothetical protein
MPDALDNNRPAPAITFADVVLNSFALLLIQIFLIVVVSLVGGSAVGVIFFGPQLGLIITYSILSFFGAILALLLLYLAKKLCERRKWSILLSALMTGGLSLLLIILTLMIDISSHLGMLTTGLLGVIATIALLSVAVLPRTT